jgi:hypothetical protein
MVNYQKTEECYIREKYRYEKPADYKTKQDWLKKVTNPHTGTFYQISDLPIEWREGKEDKPYPIKQANQIIRIKTADGKEYLKTKQQWIAVDSQGNEIMESFTDLEEWDKPVFEYGMKPLDPKKPDGPKEHGVIGVKGYKKQHDLPFNQKSLEALYKMRPAQDAGSVALIIRRLGYDGNPIGFPYQVENYEDFSTKPFDELWDYLSTPKYKLDRSYGDNLQGSHIK